jgi:FlaA1/EpsC-like NDP-sugar epimerase
MGGVAKLKQVPGISWLLQNRDLARLVGDIVCWTVALPAAVALRLDLQWSDDTASVALLLLAVVALQVLLGAAFHLYDGRYSYGAFEEARALAGTVLLVVVAGTAGTVTFLQEVPRLVPMIAGSLALVGMFAIRYAWRMYAEQRRRPDPEGAEPVLVFGAGEGGLQLITSMLRNPRSPYLPVGLLDDSPSKRQRHVRGVAVLGDRTDMASAAAATGAGTLVIAVPSASAKVMRDLSDLAAQAGLDVLVLPPVADLLGAPGIGDLRRLNEADLLGRHEIEIDLDAIAAYLHGRRVLVTGAGGSIGSELCRQINRYGPAALTMLDRDESALHAVELSIKGTALLDEGDLVVADIRDEERLAEVFDQHRPHVVFHAAALKHLPLLEQHPAEGHKTNVLGSLNVLRAALDHDVDCFVNISTDKAADPTSVLGRTKRAAERLTAWAAQQGRGTYLSVRFGNVLGSRGSVLTAFRSQIEAGGPVTVTDPEVTRYFMTVEEAVRLVIQAGAVGRDGEALVLDMGDPVRIADVAERLVRESGRNIAIVYTGLRPGEKLHEVLRADGEQDHRPAHPLISHVPVPPIDPSEVATTIGQADSSPTRPLGTRS